MPESASSPAFLRIPSRADRPRGFGWGRCHLESAFARCQLTCVMLAGFMFALPLMLLSAPAAAQNAQDITFAALAELDDAAPDFAKQSGLSFDLKVGMWLPRTGGDIQLGNGGSVSLSKDLRLDNSEPVFNGELMVQFADNWLAMISGFTFSTSQTGAFGSANPDAMPVSFGSLNFTPGDPVFAALDMTGASITIGHTVWRPLLQPTHQPDHGSLVHNGHTDMPHAPATKHINRYGRPRADLRIGPTAALRIVEVDQTVEQIGVGRERRAATFAGILAGLDVDLHYEPDEPLLIFQSISIEGYAGAGPVLGGDGGFMWDVRVGISGMITEHAGLMFGYRLLEIDASDGDFDFDAGLQGLFFGGVFRF